MLLRVSLILSILAGLGVIGVGQFVLRPQIVGIRDTRDHNEREWKRTQGELTKTKRELTQTREDLTKTKSTLEDTKAGLAATTTKFENEQKRANGLQEDKNRLSAGLKAAQDDLHAWTNSGVRVQDIPVLLASNKKLEDQTLVLKQENSLLGTKIVKLEKRIIELTQGEVDPPVPHTVRGKVLVVDPKWDFLVVDVGAKNEVPVKGVLLISRDGELVAKVRVMNVQEQRSIANILPGWKLKDVMEGDLVMAY